MNKYSDEIGTLIREVEISTSRIERRSICELLVLMSSRDGYSEAISDLKQTKLYQETEV